MIRSRAAAQVNALRSKHGAGTLDGEVRIDRIDRAYTNYFALNEYHLAHERFDGTMTDVLERAVFVATDAALVLPYDPVRDRVMLVEQLRMGPVARGDRAQWQLEPIAGRVDPGESPEDAAHREAQEEAGLTLRKLEKIAEVYASPGDSTEFFYIYLGLADLPDDSTGVNGLEAENEDIRSHLIGFDALMTMVDQLEAANAPLVIAEQFGTLAALFPGRVDLGLGRAPEKTQNSVLRLTFEASDDFGLDRINARFDRGGTEDD
ncbi:LLM class flavin-dependent oxidoreductase, partial [uncultured Sulfitobacter sp.]|uniref:LLM class flavin-dependent oxidoreductase n=1 Tax=uncultured Sulfitobacter sp. TaxID=191468 RepID=UPI00259A1886